jgi:hypothetical protein
MVEDKFFEEVVGHDANVGEDLTQRRDAAKSQMPQRGNGN